MIAVDVLPDGTVGNGSSAFATSHHDGSPFTPDGEWVLFTTRSTKLGLVETLYETTDGERTKLVARNMTTGELVRVDARVEDDAPAREPSENGDGGTATGRWFIPLAGNRILFNSDDILIDGVPEGRLHLYVKDLDTGAVEVVATKPDGTPAGLDSGVGLEPLFDVTQPLNYRATPIVWDGNEFIVVELASTDLQGPEPGSGVFNNNELFRKNLTTGSLTAIDARADGGYGGNLSASGDVHAGGGRLLFASAQNGIVAADTDGQVDPFLLDLAVDGTNGNGRSVFQGFVDSERVLLDATSTNLVAGVGNGTTLMPFLKTLATGLVIPRVLTAAGTAADPGAPPFIFNSNQNAGGTLAGQTLLATTTKLSENDLNDRYDSYLRDCVAMVDAWTNRQKPLVTLTGSLAGATSFTFDWGDGTTGTVGASGGMASLAHGFDPGTYTATVTGATPGGSVAGSVTILAGSGSAETLVDLAGNTVLAGGLGEDLFVFAAGNGQDVIAGFGPGDVVGLAAFGTTFDTLAEILAATTDTAAGARINTGGGNAIVLEGVAKADLVFSDFDAPRLNAAPFAVNDTYGTGWSTPVVGGTGSTPGLLANDIDVAGAGRCR